MDLNDTPETPPIEISWSATVLNVYTVTLLLVAPFWAAVMIYEDRALTALILTLLLAGMIGLALVRKPLFRYDVENRVFIAPDNRTVSLEQIDSIEMDVHDIYFIPKSISQDGWHLSQRCWVLAPRRVLKAHAAQYGWPLKDIASPASRFGFWLVP